MRKKHVHEGGRGLKTLFIYGALVFLLILISFSIKGFFLLQKSKFDGQNHFAVAVVKEGIVKEIISFNPGTPSYALLKVEDGKLSLSSLGKTLGVAPDAAIQTSDSLPIGDDVTQTMMAAVWQFPTIHTEMTIIDVVRLSLLSKNIQEDNKVVKEINLSRGESDADKIITSFFGDEKLTSENIPIRIVNASDMSGAGKRLERLLNNLGCNVIGVSSSAPEARSKMQYVGDQTYTLGKLKRLLKLPIIQQKIQGTGDIVITIGEDSKNAAAF
jgi:hypothetical protein